MGQSIRLIGVDHRYVGTEEGAGAEALRGVDLTITAGDFAVLMGPSGSGKSTLLHLIGAIDRPTRGRVLIGEKEISSMSEGALTSFRRRSVGFVFQFFNLIPTLTLRENIEFPLSLAGMDSALICAKTDEVIARIGLSERANHYPGELSGGEMQRVAIGRAIVHRPDLILADEPTGNLDSHTGESVLSLLREMHGLYGPTVVMATHSERAASFGNYIVDVIDGVVARR